MGRITDATILVTLAVGAQAGAQSPMTQSVGGEVEVGETAYPYRLVPPHTVVEGERYPLVLFLHGAGERGNDNERQLRHFPERMATEPYRTRFPCFILAPQCPEDGFWVNVDWSAEIAAPFVETPADSMRGAIAALTEVVRAQPVDVDRIYLTGLSMGGYGTWDLAMRHPDWFAAAVPICGGGDDREVARLAGLPLSVWHGAADRVVPVTRSRRMVEALRRINAPVDYHELDGVGHNAWVPAYDDDGCLDDVFAARRDPGVVVAAAGRLAATAMATDERVAFLGDSITQSGNEAGGYVDRLRTAITKERPEARVIPAGISGHRVPDLLERFRKDVIEQDATLVFVYIGINDVWHSQSGRGTPADAYEAGLRTIVRDLLASGADVVLATPSVIGERALGKNSLDTMLEQYAEITRTVARETGATLCDLRRAFQDHLAVFNATEQERGVLTTDGVHLNEAGNMFVATQAARALRDAALKRHDDSSAAPSEGR